MLANVVLPGDLRSYKMAWLGDTGKCKPSNSFCFVNS